MSCYRHCVGVRFRLNLWLVPLFHRLSYKLSVNRFCDVEDDVKSTQRPFSFAKHTKRNLADIFAILQREPRLHIHSGRVNFTCYVA